MRENYIFVQIEKKKAEYAAAHPENKLIDLGIGDVSGPLPAAAVRALVIACKAQGNCKTFRGYGPESGYERNCELLQTLVGSGYKTKRNICRRRSQECYYASFCRGRL